MEATELPDLSTFDWVLVNSSGGKDSQTALRETIKLAQRQGFPIGRVVVGHQDLGRVEWKGSKTLVRRQAAHYGLRVIVTGYRTKTHEPIDLLEYVRRRGKWPSSKQRFCTSEFKRGPGGRAITDLVRGADRPMRVLNVFGFRAEESPARRKKQTLARNARFSSGAREVWDWLPIHDWTEADVWESIHTSGVPYHPAYDLGMPRLSCVFCIFAPRAALIIAGRANPELLDRYCDVEAEIGHTFKNGESIASIREAIAAGEQAGPVSGAWNM